MGSGVRLQGRALSLSSLFVDTSVWSRALRRDGDPGSPHVGRLRQALAGGEAVHTTGLVLQELLQGLRGSQDREAILERFVPLPLLVPERRDQVEAARLRNTCWSQGVQLGTMDALLARLAIRHDLSMLSTDRDFEHAAGHIPLRLWKA